MFNKLVTFAACLSQGLALSITNSSIEDVAARLAYDPVHQTENIIYENIVSAKENARFLLGTFTVEITENSANECLEHLDFIGGQSEIVESFVECNEEYEIASLRLMADGLVGSVLALEDEDSCGENHPRCLWETVEGILEKTIEINEGCGSVLMDSSKCLGVKTKELQIRLSATWENYNRCLDEMIQ